MKYENFVPSLSQGVRDFFKSIGGVSEYHARMADWVREGDVLGKICVNPSSLKPTSLLEMFRGRRSGSTLEFKIVTPVTGRVGYSGGDPVWCSHHWSQGARVVPSSIEELANLGYGSSLVTNQKVKIFPSQIYGDLLSYFVSDKDHWDAISQKSNLYSRGWYESLCREMDFFESFPCPAFSEHERRTYRPLTKENQEFLDRIFK